MKDFKFNVHETIKSWKSENKDTQAGWIKIHRVSFATGIKAGNKWKKCKEDCKWITGRREANKVFPGKWIICDRSWISIKCYKTYSNYILLAPALFRLQWFPPPRYQASVAAFPNVLESCSLWTDGHPDQVPGSVLIYCRGYFLDKASI